MNASELLGRYHHDPVFVDHATLAGRIAAGVPCWHFQVEPAWGAGGEQAPAKLWVYIGTYTEKTKSEGIYRYELDMATGKLSAGELAGEAVNPSFLAIHPNHKFLYAVGEIDKFKGKDSGGVTAFALDAKTGNLTQLNQQISSGTGPCYLVVDRAGKHVLVANYGGGSISVIPIGPDGMLGEPTAAVQHKGTSVNKSRQSEPHAHSINLDAANKFALVADLGLDKILVYRYDAAKGTLTPNDPPAMATAPGAGPRHFAFHPNGIRAYVINEIDSTLTALTYDADRGVLTKGQTVSTLPKDFKGNNSTAEVVVHPSGKFVYGSNRGHNSIAIFAIDAATGTLTPTGHLTRLIKTPRNFAIDPTGKYLLAASQSSNQVVVFAVNPQTGALTFTGNVVDVPAPVCIRMMAPPAK